MARRLAGTALLVGLALCLAAPAGAHALLRSSTPAGGSRVESAPDAVTIAFTEEPEPSLSSVRVLDASGGSWEDGRPVAAPDHSLRVRLRPLPQGSYTVTWRVVSRVDGHATAGAFAFGVGVAPQPAAAPALAAAATPRPSALEMAGRWGLFLGLAALLGGGWVTASLFGGARGAPATLVAAGWVVALAGLGVLAEAQRRGAGAGFADLAATPLGRALVLRLAGIAAAGAALLAARSRNGAARRALLWVASGCAAGAMAAHVAAGHAAASDSLPWAQVGAQWIHLVAIAVWIGGLAALVLGLRGEPGPERAAVVRRFSRVAGYALAGVAATGVVRALNEVPSAGALLSTGYGRAVLAKSWLFAGLAALGAVNRYRNVPAADRSLAGLRRVSKIEVALGAAALAVAAILASLAPPRQPGAAAEAGALAVAGSDFATTVRVRLQVAPGLAGQNRFTLTIRDYDTGDPVAATRVGLRFAPLDVEGVGESVLELAQSGPGRYAAEGTNVSLEGRWRATIVVERGAESVEVALEFATRCRNSAAAAEGQPTLHTAELAGNRSAQLYADPGRRGSNDVHATFFDPSGNELPIVGDVTMRAWRPGDDPVSLAVRRFGPGHFIGGARLEPGSWRFDVTAPGPEGQPLRACFEELIRR